MVDIQIIRDNPGFVKEKSKQKGYEVDIDTLLSLDEERRELLSQVEALRQKRNEIAGRMKGSKPSEEVINEGKQVKVELAEREELLDKAESGWLALLKQVPNMPLDTVPIGATEDENKEVRRVGEQPSFDFAPKSHAQIAEAKGWIDKERAAKVAGARFAYLKGDLVLLWQALVSFGISQLTDKNALSKLIKENNLKVVDTPFTPVLPPLMIKTELYDAMDRLEPRDDRYKIEDEDLWLQGSAEHVLGSMHADEIFDKADLPVRYVGFASSFRREAGSYGKDMEGIFRLHQFDKLEMESLTTPETSLDEHLLMIAIQEHLMQQLQLPYRVLEKCTADIGKPNAKGVDIDAWLPSQKTYRETHTADFMTDYQARRLSTRYRDGDQVKLVHTNDATAFAQRPLIAIIENFQTKEGDVIVPEVLRPFMGGREMI